MSLPAELLGIAFLTGASVAAILLKIGHAAGVTGSKSSLSAAEAVTKAATTVSAIAHTAASRAARDTRLAETVQSTAVKATETHAAMTDLVTRVEKMDVALGTLIQLTEMTQKARVRRTRAQQAMDLPPASPQPRVTINPDALWGDRSETSEAPPTAPMRVGRTGLGQPT